MKNKSAFVTALGLVVLAGAVVFAAPGVRGAKGSTTAFGNTNVVAVSSSPAVLYSVILSTGAQGDYVVLFDSGAATGLSSVIQASGGYKMRVAVSSATQNTIVVFDPPLQFFNGIMAANSNAAISSNFSYEIGHVTGGY